MVSRSLVVTLEHVSDASRVFLSIFMTCEKSCFFFMIFTSDVDVLHTQHIIPLKWCEALSSGNSWGAKLPNRGSSSRSAGDPFDQRFHTSNLYQIKHPEYALEYFLMLFRMVTTPLLDSDRNIGTNPLFGHISGSNNAFSQEMSREHFRWSPYHLW